MKARLTAAMVALSLAQPGLAGNGVVRTSIAESWDEIATGAMRYANGDWYRKRRPPSGPHEAATCMRIDGGANFRSDVCYRPLPAPLDLGWSARRAPDRIPTDTGDDTPTNTDDGDEGDDTPTNRNTPNGGQGSSTRESTGGSSTQTTRDNQDPPGTNPTRSATPTPTPKPYRFRADDLEALPLSPPPLHVQPPGTDALINVPVIAYTTATPTTDTARLRGHQVTFRLTPARYTWQFGDTVITSTDPGARYPDHTVHHTYHEPGPTTITLTITWRVDYRTSTEGPWQTTGQTRTTTSEPHHLNLITATPHLIP